MLSARDYLKSTPGQTAEQIGPAAGNTGSRRPSTLEDAQAHARGEAEASGNGNTARPQTRPSRPQRSSAQASARVSERPAAQAAEQPSPASKRPANRTAPHPDAHPAERPSARPSKRPAARSSARPAPTLYAGGGPDQNPLRRIVLVAGAVAVCALLVFGAVTLFSTCSAPPPEGGLAAEAEPESPPTPEERLAALPAVQVELAELDLPTGTEPQAFAPAPAEGSTESVQPVLSDASKAAIDQAFAPFAENDRSFGFALVDLGTGRGIAANVDAAFYGASSFKGPYCVYFCQSQIETGLATRDDFVASGVMDESGVFSSQGSDLIGSMIESAILFSSNDTYGALRNDYSDDALAAYLEDLGVDPALAYDTWFPHYTVRDGMRLWLNASEYLTSGTETAQWLAGLFEKDETSYLREALSDENAQVQSKPGWSMESFENGEYNALCDAGIVVKDGRRYLVSVMSNIPYTTSNVELFEDVIAAVFAARGDLA